MTWGEVAEAFEAEGGFLPDKQPPSYRLRIGVGNNVKEWIEDICESVGFGRVERRAAKNKTVRWHWRCGRGEAREILDAVYPYLSLRRAQARIAIVHLADQEKHNLSHGRIARSEKLREWKEQIVFRRRERYLRLKEIAANLIMFACKAKTTASKPALAAFADGEGNIQIRRQNRGTKPKTYKLIVKISNKYRGKLERYLVQYGGSIGLVKSTGVYEWEVSGERAAAFLADMYPYLRIKDLQAWLGICFYLHFARYVANNWGRGVVDAEELRCRDEAARLMRYLHALDEGSSGSGHADFAKAGAKVNNFVLRLRIDRRLRPKYPQHGRFSDIRPEAANLYVLNGLLDRSAKMLMTPENASHGES